MDPLKKDQEWLGDDKQTLGLDPDDSGKGGEGGLDTEWLTERQIFQVAGLRKALDARDADISLIEEHGLRFVADNTYLAELPEDVGRKLIERLKRTKSISIDMEYDDIIAGLNKWGGQVDPNKVADIALKRMTAINEEKETNNIVSQALSGIEDEELKTRFQNDYKELSWGKKLSPAVAKKLSDTIINWYRFELTSQRGVRERALTIGSSAVQGSRIGSQSAQNNGRKNYEAAVALWWDDATLAKYYPEFHSPKK